MRRDVYKHYILSHGKTRKIIQMRLLDYQEKSDKKNYKKSQRSDRSILNGSLPSKYSEASLAAVVSSIPCRRSSSWKTLAPFRALDLKRMNSPPNRKRSDGMRGMRNPSILGRSLCSVVISVMSCLSQVFWFTLVLAAGICP
jgi:hypothetical protein